MIADLRQQQLNTIAEIEEITADRDKRVKELEELQQVLEKRKSENATLREKVAQLEQESHSKIAELEGKVAHYELQESEKAQRENKVIEDLRTRNNVADKEIDRLRNELSTASEEHYLKVRDLEKLIEYESAKIDDLKAQLKEKSADAQRVLELEEELQKSKKRLKKAEEHVEQVERQLELTTQTNSSTEEGIYKYKIELGEMEKKYKEASRRVEELEDDVDKLSKREKVLSEIEETCEKRIAELETELKDRLSTIEQLQEATHDHSGAKDAELAKLHEYVKQIEEQQRNIEKENDKYKRQITELQKRTEERGAEEGRSGGKEVETIERELRETKLVEEAVYWTEMGYNSSADVTNTSWAVWQLLLSANALEEKEGENEDGEGKSKLTPLTSKIVLAISKSGKRAMGDDVTSIAYWLSCVCSLLHFIHQRYFSFVPLVFASSFSISFLYKIFFRNLLLLLLRPLTLFLATPFLYSS